MNHLVTNRGESLLLKPLHDRVLVKRLPEPELSVRRFKIWIPDIARENTKFAEVISVGEQVKGVQVGDKILVPGIAAKLPDWEQQDIMLIQEADIGGIFG